MLLQLKNIKKSFGKVEVLKGITFSLDEGMILGLIGENGAGKSTMMNLLGGIFPPTAGEMFLNGETYLPNSPIAAQSKGVAFIHQELNLFPNLSIAENLFINQFPKKRFFGVSRIDKKTINVKAKELLGQVGLTMDPNKKVEELSPAPRQLVEIAKALGANPKIIIFDEPTTSLSHHEAKKLFELIKKLKAQGIAMIYISHNLDDVLKLVDSVAILRDGELVRMDEKKSFDIQTMVKEMVGREMLEFFPGRMKKIGKKVLEVENLTAKGFIKDVTFHIKKQEVVGFYGLVGAGRSEMVRVLYGLDRFDSGSIVWKGELIDKTNPVLSIQRGIAFLTEDRIEEGLLTRMNIQKNAQLAALGHFTKGLLHRINRFEAKEKVKEKVYATKTKYENLTEQLVSTLSGGNQQKIVLAKWLLTDPELLILDEPTKGIDIGAKREIYGLINNLVENGSSVLMISSELEELMGLCDRIIVMSKGKITASFDKSQFERNTILEVALHKQTAIL
ncbi:MAG: ABC transporter [Flavobacteriaceae bacterium]|nr:MAG: ABC transporter [Flavobacteriaceae bacterium]